MSPTSFLSFLFMMETEAMINSPQWQHPPTPTTQKTGMDDVLRPRRRDVPLAAAQPKPDRGKPGSVQTFPAPTRPTRRRVARARGLPIAWQPSDDDRHHRPPNLISRPPTASSLPDCSRSSTTLPGASGRFRYMRYVETYCTLGFRFEFLRRSMHPYWQCHNHDSIPVRRLTSFTLWKLQNSILSAFSELRWNGGNVRLEHPVRRSSLCPASSNFDNMMSPDWLVFPSRRAAKSRSFPTPNTGRL
ncbi:hypothetical protein CISG_06576 [Coccidioides immitis RMSCC 3703]|uniref:Uncharacterized protein n=2 Tax=Coccidioides immitis TaxID=5501 RepID=A0A0J8R1X5_COCIT|nr:hypothetical protein CIRG_05872 [Coccidioides immitis RMSCC 2394]KMU78340.1 hypothetical protein CISG_06576 [Coccidioides immitis RMSCC 3703]